MVTTFAHGLTVAYCVMGFVSLFAYLPQMLAYWRSPAMCASTPLLTWSLWGVQTVVFHAYALCVNGDPVFILTTGMSMVATLGCLALIVRGRRQNSQTTPRTPVVVAGGNVVPLRTPPKAA